MGASAEFKYEFMIFPFLRWNWVVMKLVLALIIAIFLLSPVVHSASTSVHQDPLEVGFFPGISVYPYVKLPYRRTVDGHHYYIGDDKYYKNDRVLLLKAMELYSDALSYDELIEKYNEQYNKIDNVINKFDIGKQLADAVVAAHTLDAKTALYFAWQYSVGPKVKKALGDPALFDVLEEAIKGAIDIAVEKFKWDVAFLEKFFPEYLTKSLGYILAYYDGMLKSVTLVNALRAIEDTSDPIAKQGIKFLEFRFINDYVFKYKSDINAMKDALLLRIDNQFLKEQYKKNIVSFWGVWILYVSLINDNKSLVGKVMRDYDNPPFDGRGGWFGELARAGMEAADYINSYGHGLYFSSLTPKLKELGSGKYGLAYELVDVSPVNSLYFMPKDLSVLKFEFGGGVLSKNYLLIKSVDLKVTQPSLKTVVDLDGGGETVAEEDRYVSYVNHYTVNINVYDNNALLKDEKMSASATDFVIPAYLGDLSESDYSNKNIAELFNSRVIIGNKDGSFNAKGNISIGELLKVVSLSLMDGGRAAETMENENTVAFSKYRKFLSGKGIVIGEEGESVLSDDRLSVLATRGYVAKLLNNIRRTHVYGRNQIVTCKNPKISYKNDWDTCSWELRESEYVAANDYYRKDDYIARDEVFALLNRMLNKNGGRF